MNFSVLPQAEVILNSRQAHERVCDLLGEKVPAATFRRWRRETELNQRGLPLEEAWMLAIFGRFIRTLKNVNQAIEATNNLISQAKENQHV